MSVRVKFVFVGVLLLLAVVVAVIATIATIQAFQGLQQQNSLVHAGDIHTLQDWMTIPYIARTYHVPENYLYESLHITDAQKPRHDTLRILAARYHWSIIYVIRNIESAIQAYRSQHPPAQKTPGSMIGPVNPMKSLLPGYPQGNTPTIYVGVYSRGIPLRIPWLPTDDWHLIPWKLQEGGYCECVAS